MSQDVRTRTRPDELGSIDGLGSLDGPGPSRGGGVGFGLGDFFGLVWRFFINMRTGLWLILGLGILSLPGTLIQQVGPETTGNEAAYQTFLDAMRGKYGGWAVVFDKLGLFHVFSTWYFRALTLVLCLSILACSINRAPRLWKIARHPRLHMGETFFDHAPLHADVVLPESTEAAAAHIEGVFHKHHYAVTREDTGKGVDLYADRFKWGPFGTVLAHVSFVLLVLGFVASASLGFKNEAFVAPIGTKVDVGNGTGLTLEAKSFQDSYYADGQPKDYVSNLVLYKGGTQVAQQDVRVNSPLRYDGITFHQASYGIAEEVTVKDKAGKVLYQGAVPLNFSSSDGVYSIGRFEVPGTPYTGFVVKPASGQVVDDIKAGQVQFEIHKQDVTDPVAVEVVDTGKSTTAEGLTFAYDRSRQYTQLIVRKDPGALLVWIGSALFIAGLILVFFFPHRRIWLRLTPVDGGTEMQTASTMKRDQAFEPQFNQLMSEIQLAGTPSSPQK